MEKKIKSVRDELKKKVDGPAAAAAAATEDNVGTSGDVKAEKQAALVVNMLDEVAWLFNLRGSDIDYNPGMYPPRFSPDNALGTSFRGQKGTIFSAYI